MRHSLLTLDDSHLIACDSAAIHLATLHGRRLSLRQWKWLYSAENRSLAWADWSTRAGVHDATREAEEAGLIGFSPSLRLAMVKAEHQLREEFRVLTWLDEMAAHVRDVIQALVPTHVKGIVVSFDFEPVIDRLNALKCAPVPPEPQPCSVTSHALHAAAYADQEAAA